MLLTDSNEIYDNSNEGKKLLFSDLKIVKSTFLSENRLLEINTQLGEIEFSALEFLLEDFSEILKSKISFTRFALKFVQKRDNRTKLFSTLYKLFYETRLVKYRLFYVVKELLKNLKEIDDYRIFQIHLSNNFYFVNENEIRQFCENEKINLRINSQNDNKRVLKLVLSSCLKNFYYFTFSKIKKPKKIVNSKKNILFVTYDLEHHISILNNFFHLVESGDFNLHIVIYESGLDTNHSLRLKEYKNIYYYRFKDFKKSYPIPIFRAIKIKEKFAQEFSLYDVFYSLNSNYQHHYWMDNIFKILNPDVCFQMTTHEIGRYLADVAYFHEKPSLQVDYALFSDDPKMDKNISFTKKLAISESIIDIWKKRNDNSKLFETIGYCKFDSIQVSSKSTNEFLKENNLNSNQKTILFSSTWGNNETAYLIERNKIVDFLSDFCNVNSFNLIIKKHPLEFDVDVDLIVSNKNYFNQKVFQHTELSIFDAINYADIVLNQMSSIVLECLYFSKPFAFISLNRIVGLSEISVFKDELFCNIIVDEMELENFLLQMLRNELKYRNFILEMEKRKEYFLFSTDGKTSERLLDNLLNTKFIA